MKLRVAFLLLVVALAGPPGAQAAGRAECAALESKALGRAVKYCVLLPASYDADKARRYPVLYFLHGLFDNEQSFVNSGGWNMVEGMQARGEIAEYLVVTPDGGRSFYVNSQNGRVKYEDFLIHEFLPAIERKYRVRAGRGARGIGGISMGGYGALHMGFKYPRLFGSVSAHSAALIQQAPRGQLLGTGTQLDILGSVFGSPIDAAHFRRNSPFTLAAENAAALRRSKIYFDCGREDGYGFFRGAQALHEQLERDKVPHEFHLYPGRHDWQYFAEHLPDSLRFHSRAFSGK